LFRSRRVLWSINKPLGLAFNVIQEFVIPKKCSSLRKWKIRVRSFSHKGSLFWSAIKELVIFLVGGVSIFYCTPPKFNKVSPSSTLDVHTICLIGGIMLNCVLFFYTLKYLLPSLFLLVAHRSCVASAAPPQWLVMGAIQQFSHIVQYG